MAHHSGQVQAVGRLGDLHGLGCAGGQGLLHQHVLAGAQRRHGERVVGGDRRRDDDGIDIGGEHLPVVAGGPRTGVKADDMRQPVR